MKKAITLLLFVVVALAAASRVPAEWKSRYQMVTKAMSSRNEAAFRAFFSKDFIYVDPKGKTASRDELLKELHDMFQANKITAHVELKKVTMRGDRVDVAFDLHVIATVTGKGSTSVHEVGVDTWKKIDGKWQFVKTVDSTMTMTPK